MASRLSNSKTLYFVLHICLCPMPVANSGLNSWTMCHNAPHDVNIISIRINKMNITEVVIYSNSAIWLMKIIYKECKTTDRAEKWVQHDRAILRKKANQVTCHLRDMGVSAVHWRFHNYVLQYCFIYIERVIFQIWLLNTSHYLEPVLWVAGCYRYRQIDNSNATKWGDELYFR